MVDTAAARPRRRRTQSERSEAMRERLIDATLQCLVSEGYAGTTVSKIVQAARVSRGASVHHFPSKAVLIEAAAEQLVRRFYILFGKMINAVDASDERVHEMVRTGWQMLTTPEITALLELLVASRQEAELAAMMQKLWVMAYQTMRNAGEHYLEPVTPADDVGDLIVLSQWLLRGMAEDFHVSKATAVVIDTEQFFEHYLRLWTRMLAGHLRVRPGVNTPPPRPKYWDASLSDPPASE